MPFVAVFAMHGQEENPALWLISLVSFLLQHELEKDGESLFFLTQSLPQRGEVGIGHSELQLSPNPPSLQGLHPSCN